MKNILKAVKMVGMKAAKGSINSASAIYIYQPKAPSQLRSRFTKKEQ